MGAFLSGGRRSRPAVCSSQRSPHGSEGERVPRLISVARVSQNLAALRREISSSASALNMREMDRSMLDAYVANLEFLMCETELLASRELPGNSGAVFSPEKIRMLRDYLNDVKSYSCRTFSPTMSEQVMAHLDLLRSREMALGAGLPEGLSQKAAAQTGPRLQQIASDGAGLCHNGDKTSAGAGRSRGGKGPEVEAKAAMNFSSAGEERGAGAPRETQHHQGEGRANDLCEPLARPCSTCKANAALPGRDHGLCRACLALACQRLDNQQLRAGPSTPQQPQPKPHQAPTAIAATPLQDQPMIPPRGLSDHGRPLFLRPPLRSTVPMVHSNKRRREEGPNPDPEPRPGTEGNRIPHNEPRLGSMAEGELPTSKIPEPKRHHTSGPSGGVVSDGKGVNQKEAQRDRMAPCHSSPSAMRVTRPPCEGGGARNAGSAEPGDVLKPAGPHIWEKEVKSPAEEEPSSEAGVADSDKKHKVGSGESRKYYSADGSVSIADTEVVAVEQMATGTAMAEKVSDDGYSSLLSHDVELAEAMEVRGSDTEVVEEEAAEFPEDEGGGADDVHGHDAEAEHASKDCIEARTRHLGAGVHQRRQSGGLPMANHQEGGCMMSGGQQLKYAGADETDGCSTEQVEIADSGTEEEDEGEIEVEGVEESNSDWD